MARQGFRKLTAWLSWFFSSETIGDLPQVAGTGAKQPFLIWLLKPEKLPCDETASAGRGASLLSWLFASEALPAVEKADKGAKRRPFLATLFSREELPLDAEQKPRPGSRGPRS